MKTTVLSLALFAAAALPAAFAADALSDLSVKLDLPYTSRYVYRGLQLANGSIQPSLDLSADNSYLGAWFNSPISAGQKSELDLYLGHEVPADFLGKGWKLDFGAREYYFPQGYYNAHLSDTSFEPYVGLTGGSIVGGITPSVYNYYDFTRRSYNVIGSLGAALPTEKMGFALQCDVHVGYTNFEHPVDGRDYTYWGGGVTLPYKITKDASLHIGTQYDSSDLTGARHNLVTWTAGVSVGF